MKRLIAGLLAGLTLGGAATAGAATTFWSHTTGGIHCEANSNGKYGPAVRCMPTNYKGYSAFIDKGLVVVSDLKTGKVVFYRSWRS
jgi:hypothetical protein